MYFVSVEYRVKTFDNHSEICYDCYVKELKVGGCLADKNTLNEIRKSIEGYVGFRVTLKANKGRKRVMIREGVIENAYPSIFIVKVDGEFDSSRRVSYSYSDVLTETVQLTVNEDNSIIKVS